MPATEQHQPCPGCGRMPAPNRVLVGWWPCSCGGHRTHHCLADGCDTTRYTPPRGPECEGIRLGPTPDPHP